jgi:hypothetical protein
MGQAVDSARSWAAILAVTLASSLASGAQAVRSRMGDAEVLAGLRKPDPGLLAEEGQQVQRVVDPRRSDTRAWLCPGSPSFCTPEG